MIGRVFFLRPERATLLAQDLAVGVLAAQLAGLVMLVAMTLLFGLRGQALFPQLVGAVVLGPEAAVGLHVPALLLGLCLHVLGPALAWGLVFGLLVRLTGAVDGRGPTFLAAGVALAAWLLDVKLLVPWLSTALHGTDLWAIHVPEPWSALQHLLFAVGLAYASPWAREQVLVGPAAPGGPWPSAGYSSP